MLYPPSLHVKLILPVEASYGDRYAYDSDHSVRVAALLLEDHLDHCVKEALQNQERADEKMGDLKAAVEQFLRMEKRG
jgi:hypothetical protein